MTSCSTIYSSPIKCVICSCIVFNMQQVRISSDLINPRRACAARLQYLICAVCVSVCLLSHISPMERLFVLTTLSRTERATKVKIFVGICLKRLRSRVMPRNMSEKANMLIIPTYPRSAFSAWHTTKRRRVLNDCQQHSALPKTTLTYASSPRWSENWQHHALQLTRGVANFRARALAYAQD